MRSLQTNSRCQVGIGTLAVFIAMVLVAVLAGGVLLETTGMLQGKSAATSQQSSSQVTDRVGVESAVASYSSGNMQGIDIVLSKAPGSGDIDLSETVVHWLGPNGSTELTDSTLSITAIKGSGTVLEERSDRMQVSNFGKTIPDGTPATVRFITAEGGTTTVILRTPNAPPRDGDVSLLWRSPTGNPASGSATATPTATATATATPTPTPTPTPTSPSLNQEWTYSHTDGAHEVAAEAGTSLYLAAGINSATYLELYPSNGSVAATGPSYGFDGSLGIDDNDEAVWENGGYIYRWDRSSDSVEQVFNTGLSVEDVAPYGGDFYVSSYDDDTMKRFNPDGTVEWESNGGTSEGVDTTSNAVYASWDDNVRKWDHNGNVQWTKMSHFEKNYDVAAGHSSYVFTVDADGQIFRLQKSDGSYTSIYSSTAYDADLEVGPDDYLYVADDSALHVLKDDGTEVLTKNYGSEVQDVEVRSDGIYVVVNWDTLYKYTKSGF